MIYKHEKCDKSSIAWKIILCWLIFELAALKLSSCWGIIIRFLKNIPHWIIFKMGPFSMRNRLTFIVSYSNEYCIVRVLFAISLDFKNKFHLRRIIRVESNIKSFINYKIVGKNIFFIAELHLL